MELNSFRGRVEYAALLGAAALFRWLPRPLSYGLASAVGALGSRVIKLRKRVAVENLMRAFPELSPREAEERYIACWAHLAKVGAELARMSRLNFDQMSRYIDGSDIAKIPPIIARGKGIIFVSGHLGNWEWLGAMTAMAGIPITYVVAGQSNRMVEEWLDRMRQGAGVEIINRRDPAKAILTALKRGRVIAMLSDQDAGNGGVFTEFFGHPASTPRGPAVFYSKTGAPLVFGSCMRQKDGKYRISYEELIPPASTDDRQADETAVMSLVSARIEQEIRQYPEQYLWLHRRWKTKPDFQ